ncbi:hypothetical protein CEUSTIGMA_g1167.t1 [Chlamydomonas eustigma]|uniref:Transmembrane protein n=1 Tax=Chlamydomonas eustigma TaxID=1157962 RepID=A0A250WSB1_9CHLO|nr:hypothetical protein CEUSTIGMA_g1167.t1 [Chlamydomonas eustigma]|eukprot:GAX73714.1 hypothetical protein CEUSTIGMA_g1167.t1 [Chlamydomonas eustigma]
MLPSNLESICLCKSSVFRKCVRLEVSKLRATSLKNLAVKNSTQDATDDNLPGPSRRFTSVLVQQSRPIVFSSALAIISTVLPAYADESKSFSLPNFGNDLVVGIFFYSVVALLTVVTAGIVYLGVVQALDKKQEMDDKKEVVSRLKSFGLKNGRSDGEEALVGQKQANRPKRDKSKGFGSFEDS